MTRKIDGSARKEKPRLGALDAYEFALRLEGGVSYLVLAVPLIAVVAAPGTGDAEDESLMAVTLARSLPLL